MKQYRLREGDITAVDTKTQLTTAGSETAPGPLMVPSGMKFITRVFVATVQNMAAATGFSAFLRLEGAGLPNGPESLAAAAGGNAVATGGNFVNRVVSIPLNLAVSEGNEIQIFGEMAGTDVGQLGMVVGLEFSDVAGAGDAIHKTLTVEGDITTADAATALLTQGSIVSPSLIIPAGFNRIRKLVLACTAEGLANASQNYFIRLTGSAVLGGVQLIPVSAAGCIAVQSGSDASPQCMPAIVLDDLDIVVSPSDTIAIYGEGAGTDEGTAHMVASLIMAKA